MLLKKFQYLIIILKNISILLFKNMVCFERKRQERLAGTLQSEIGTAGLENIRQIYQIWMAFILCCYDRIYYAKIDNIYQKISSIWILYTFSIHNDKIIRWCAYSEAHKTVTETWGAPAPVQQTAKQVATCKNLWSSEELVLLLTVERFRLQPARSCGAAKSWCCCCL